MLQHGKRMRSQTRASTTSLRKNGADTQDSPGANDNGSGVGALLEFARAAAQWHSRTNPVRCLYE